MNEDKSPTVSEEEVRITLNIGRNRYYEALKLGQIPSLEVGKRRIIPRKAWEEWLESASKVA